ncbi:tctex1 domain-containing protein 3-like [Ostrinia furnacalis]|uniref:tctex1 domain-containing protein 3-like n=1 Tax=Ostrinia furnacalis TaxID=93504 RepID=UPI00103E7756|nr:tctex1 domain-containing protein 3-like [Ostrinia furnacalis]
MGDAELKKSKVSMLAVNQSTTKSLAALGQKSLSRMKIRRPSFGFTGVPGIKPVERTSQLAFEFKRPPLVYSPTFQLDPHEKFHLEHVTKIVEEMIDENFAGHKYNVQESPALALRLAGELMRKIKAMAFNRYRVISVVTIGQKRSQSFNNAISFIWDFERDNYVESHRETATAFIQITLFAIYLD